MLKISDLNYSYAGPNNPALANVNIQVSPGKLILVTGPSGSGKSTLLHCINGLAPRHYGGILDGQICIAGRDIAGKSLWEISELAGTVFQNPNTQFFQLTVEDEIMFGLEHSGLDPETVVERLELALADVEIEHLRYRDLFTLSSGEKQKVALASILAMDQPLLLMDEPTANLDISSIHELKHLLGKLKKQGRTMVISEHRLWYLRELADQVVVIKNGALVYDGPPDKLASSNFRQKAGLRIWDHSPEVEDRPGQSGPNVALEVQGLYGSVGRNKQIVNNVNFAVEAGACIAVMGHNGAGKTTLSRIITGLQKEDKGVISIKGEVFKPKSRIGRIGCVTQQAEQQLFSDTVLGELLLSPQNDNTDDVAAKDILKQYDLLELKDRHPQALSGGEKQRLAIAALMALDPEIIILDEPTSGLDMMRMRKLAAEIKKLCDQKIPVIIITHDIELVLLCCDKILWVDNGTIARTIYRSQYQKFFYDLMKFEKPEAPK